jgi:predicted permease
MSGLLAFSLIYAVVVAVGQEHARPDPRYVARRLLMSPPLWAIAVSVTMRAAGLSLPGFLHGAVAIVAELVSPAILLALGLMFTLRIDKPRLLAIPLLLRFGLGTLLAAVFVRVTGLSGLSATMVYLVGIAPIGYNSVAFAEMEQLDTGFAVSQVSVALLMAFAVIPLVA